MYEITIKQIIEPLIAIKTNFDDMSVEELDLLNKQMKEHNNGDNIKTTEIYKQCVDELDLNKVIIAVNGIGDDK